MDIIAIISLVAKVIELGSKYIDIAKKNSELSPEEEASFRTQLATILKEPYMQIDEDPKE